jgi:hypothetical protein
MDMNDTANDDALTLPGGTRADDDSQEEPPHVATPENSNNNNEAAAAAAEVAAQREGPDHEADQYEAVDESGELVRQAFLQFLQD